MRFSTASEWITWMTALNAGEMKFGLDRIKEVAGRLGILKPRCLVITVGGTNGKGSTVAGLESIYRAAGYQVGAFTSPMLFKPNEQIRINGQEVSDDELCAACEEVAAALQDTQLTQFEFFTLAALVIFKKYVLNVLILEVGLGGRLDAVNIIDADVAIVTTIALDHTEWLGATREKIAYEKAGIFRTGKPAICGDFDPPQSLIDYANQIQAPLFFSGERKTEKVTGKLATQNLSTILMAIALLQPLLPVSENTIKTGLEKVNVPGRIQIIPGEVTKIFDVSHNPAAVSLLASVLPQTDGATFAVFSMLADKDIIESINTIKDKITHWYVAPLPIKRAATHEQLKNAFEKANVKTVSFFSDINTAYKTALQNAKSGDCIVVFGSFHTLAALG